MFVVNRLLWLPVLDEEITIATDEYGVLYEPKIRNLPYHLYILSDEPPQEGDWVYTPIERKIKLTDSFTDSHNQDTFNVEKSKRDGFKIIATTNKKIQTKNNIILNIPKWYVTYFITQYNKGQPPLDVLVKYYQPHEKVKINVLEDTFNLVVNPVDGDIYIRLGCF